MNFPSKPSHVYAVLTTFACVVFAGSAVALPESNPSCGVRSKNPQAYDFCMQQTGQASSNPVSDQMPGAYPTLGNNSPPKPRRPTTRATRAQCVKLMVSKQHMTAADAAVACEKQGY